MMGSTEFQSDRNEYHDPDWEQLKRENGSLRAIIADLLVKNQNLRWELLGNSDEPAHCFRSMSASEGTPLCRNSLMVGIP